MHRPSPGRGWPSLALALLAVPLVACFSGSGDGDGDGADGDGGSSGASGPGSSVGGASGSGDPGANGANGSNGASGTGTGSGTNTGTGSSSPGANGSGSGAGGGDVAFAALAIPLGIPEDQLAEGRVGVERGIVGYGERDDTLYGWVTDGTPEGTSTFSGPTISLFTSEPSVMRRHIPVVGDRAFRLASIPEPSGTALVAIDAAGPSASVVVQPQSELGELRGVPMRVGDAVLTTVYSQIVLVPGSGGSPIRIPAEDATVVASNGEIGLVAVQPGEDQAIKELRAIDASGDMTALTVCEDFCYFEHLTRGATADGTMFFVLNLYGGDETVRELWTSQGTPETTERVTAIPCGVQSATWGTSLVSDAFLFFDCETEEDGYELWSSDGTAGGTQRITQYGEGALSGIFVDDTWWTVGDDLYFLSILGDGSNPTLATVSDGTEAGTHPITDVPAWRYEDFTVAGGHAYFIVEDVNGIAMNQGVVGRVPLAGGDIELIGSDPMYSSPIDLFAHGDLVTFQATHQDTFARDLWALRVD